MKIYLATNKTDKTNYQWASNLPMLDGILLDSVGTDIICDDFLSSFNIEEIIKLLEKLTNKLRLNGKLTIAEVDSNIICRRYYNQEISEIEMNTILFTNQKRKSFLIT